MPVVPLFEFFRGKRIPRSSGGEGVTHVLVCQSHTRSRLSMNVVGLIVFLRRGNDETNVLVGERNFPSNIAAASEDFTVIPSSCSFSLVSTVRQSVF